MKKTTKSGVEAAGIGIGVIILYIIAMIIVMLFAASIAGNN